mmetsp:Transcript_34657/g.51362  ORF Transcript_34657/g.51362 Transcript_34657/m.51362 type:complete len:84 (-) Transcript_34657:544-795(-)
MVVCTWTVGKVQRYSPKQRGGLADRSNPPSKTDMTICIPDVGAAPSSTGPATPGLALRWEAMCYIPQVHPLEMKCLTLAGLVG